MGVDRWEGRRNLCYLSWLWKKRVFLEHSLALESRGEAQGPRFVSWREAVLGDGPAMPFHPLLQLGCLGEIMTHGEGRGEGGGWLNHPAMVGQGSLSPALGAHRGACWATFHGDGKEVCRVASWGGESFQVGLKGGGGTGGTERMVMGDVQHRCLPAHRCMPRKKVKRSWFPPQVPGSVFRAYPRLASTIRNFSEEQHPLWRAWWYSSPAPQAGPGGGMQQRSRTSPRGAQGRGNRDWDEDLSQPKRTAITRKSTMWNATDPLVLTSRTHLKLLSSPGTNCCCTLFNREKRDFK